MGRLNAYIITAIVAAIFGFFFLYPVASVLDYAFRDQDQNLTFKYFLNVFQNPVYLEGLWNALKIGVASTIATFAIAFPLALISHRYNFPGKKWLSIFILIPLVLPPFVGAVGVKQMLGVNGSLNALLYELGLMDAASPYDWLGHGRFWGIVVMNALHLYPILYINILAALNNLDPTMEQAAQNLGCSPWRRLRKITLPLCMPGIFAGAAIVFIWSFTELGVPLVFDYNRVASVQVYDGIKNLNENPMPYALVAVMLIASFSIFLFSKLVLGNQSFGSSARPKSQSSQKDLNWKTGGWITIGFTLLVIIASIPHFGVLFMSVAEDWYGTMLPGATTSQHYSDGLGHPLVIGSIKNSLLYASGATILDVIVGLAIAWVIVRSTVWGRNVLDALLMLPLAVPGLVLAFGYLTLSEPGQPFYFLVGPLGGNPVFLLIVAYAIRRIPYVVRAAVAGLEQSNPELEEAALSLGAKPTKMLRRVAIPLIGSNLAAGAILAFAFAMLEVSDSLILAQQAEHFPITKAIYALLSTLGNGHEIASALGVWAMIFLGIAITGAFALVGKRSGGLFKL